MDCNDSSLAKEWFDIRQKHGVVVHYIIDVSYMWKRSHDHQYQQEICEDDVMNLLAEQYDHLPSNCFSCGTS